MTVKWTGLEQFFHEVEERAKFIRKKLGNDILAETVKLTPVDTGTLRNGWQFDHSDEIGGQWLIHNEVEYGPYVEFGTPKMKGRFMLARSVQRVAARFPDIVNEAVKRG